MRLVVVAIITVLGLGTSCGGRSSAPSPPAASETTVMRWVPAKPTYVVSSPKLELAQRSVRDLLDVLGTVAGFEVGEVTRGLSGLLGVDPLHPDPLAAIGVDPRGGWVAFSEQLNPTLVLRLAAPEQMTAFLDHQRDRGMVTQSVMVDQTVEAAGATGGAKAEVFSAKLPGHVTISWAIVGEWMWVHFALPLERDDGVGWFTASYQPHPAAWADHWAWAQRAAGAAAGLVGFLDLRGAVAELTARLPDAIACTRLAAPVGRVALAVEGDDRHVAARIALDVGSTAALQPLLLRAPGGWGPAAADASIAAQWNLDLAAVRAWLAPCLAAAEVDLAALDAVGVRAGRGLLRTFDPDAKSGTGVIALDLARPAFFAQQLDRIPLRRTFERTRTFGRYQGHAISIPFSLSIDYVLDATHLFAGIGDGLLAQLLASDAPPPQPPIAALDITPPAMSAQAWATVIHALVEQELWAAPSHSARRLADRLLRWQHVHLALAASPTELVLGLEGHRR